MYTKLLLEYANIIEIAVGVAVLALMVRKRLFSQFPLLAAFLIAQTLEGAVTTPLLFFRKNLGVSIDFAYRTFFATHWVMFVVQAVLFILIIHSAFRLALEPLQGLHEMGKIIFRWIAGVSLALSVGMALGPHLASSGFSATIVWTTMATQLQQGISVLTLCLLLFVCFAARPLGLTFRCRVFGMILGLGTMASTNLIMSAWYSTAGAHSVYSPVYLVSTGGSLLALAIWGTYFVLPEPERKLILLPTTSPFFFWNRISEALGDDPGHVAVAGFRPDMLAPAELAMLRAAAQSDPLAQVPPVAASNERSAPLQAFAVNA